MKSNEAMNHESLKSKQESSGMIYAIYLSTAFLLGLGAPIGSLVFQYGWLEAAEFKQWVRHEWQTAHWFYLYMMIGTTAVFMAAAWVAACIHARLHRKTRRLASLSRALEDLAVKDSLTGLYQFPSVKAAVGVEIERSRRFQTPLSCLLIDIDRLKEINEKCGYPAGDAALRSLAQMLDKNIRIIDTPARFGGDEFFVLLPVTSREGAMIVAERLKKQVRKMAIKTGAFTVRLRITVGIASYPSLNTEDCHSFIKAAEQQLKAEKEHLEIERKNPTDDAIHLSAQKMSSIETETDGGRHSVFFQSQERIF